LQVFTNFFLIIFDRRGVQYTAKAFRLSLNQKGIVYNFIGAFDFEAAMAQAETEQEQTKTA